LVEHELAAVCTSPPIAAAVVLAGVLLVDRATSTRRARRVSA
jgi:hypothetical protein